MELVKEYDICICDTCKYEILRDDKVCISHICGITLELHPFEVEKCEYYEELE